MDLDVSSRWFLAWHFFSQHEIKYMQFLIQKFSEYKYSLPHPNPALSKKSSKLTIKTQGRHSGLFFVNYIYISLIVLVFPLSALNYWMSTGWSLKLTSAYFWLYVISWKNFKDERWKKKLKTMPSWILNRLKSIVTGRGMFSAHGRYQKQ